MVTGFSIGNQQQKAKGAGYQLSNTDYLTTGNQWPLQKLSHIWPQIASVHILNHAINLRHNFCY